MKLLRNIFFTFCILFYGVSVGAQSFPEKGVGAWHSLPFADVRLLSCSTGSLDRNMLVGGIQIKIHPGWILQKPTLKPLSDNAAIEYPIRPHPVNFNSYTGTILIPLIYDISTHKDFIFGVQGNLIACQADDCLDFPIRLTIPIDASESDYTSYCAYIMDEVNQIPKPAFIGLGQWLDNHTSVLNFYVPKVEQAFLQNQNGLNFKVVATHFGEGQVQFKVSYPEIWENKTMQDWILITNQGVFRVPIMLDTDPLPQQQPPRPWGKFLWFGLLLFVCSPFFILLGTAFPGTTKKLQQQCLRAIICSGILMLFTLFMGKYVPFFGLEGKYVQIFTLFLMGITLMFTPKFVEWAALLFVFWPKPYLKEMVQSFSLYYLIPWVLLWQVIPFAILYRYAEFWGKKARFSLKKDFFCHNLFFLLPTICLFGWGIYRVRLDIPYENHLDLQKINVVCERTDCVSWTESEFKIQLIDAESAFGKTLLDLNQAKKNLIIFDDEGTQTILVDVNLRRLNQYLIGLKNYRAGYKQVDPLVHFGDDPHAPLPNAN